MPKRLPLPQIIRAYHTHCRDICGFALINPPLLEIIQTLQFTLHIEFLFCISAQKQRCILPCVFKKEKKKWVSLFKSRNIAEKQNWICVIESEFKVTLKGTILANQKTVPCYFQFCCSASCLLSQLITSPQCARGLWGSHCRLLPGSNTECKSGRGTGEVKRWKKESGCRSKETYFLIL